MPSISVTELSIYQTCPTKHDYIYNQRLAKEGQDYAPMRLGTIYHEIMSHVLQAGYYKTTPTNHIQQLIDWSARMWDKANRPVKTFEFEGQTFNDEQFYVKWDETLETAKLLAELTVDRLDVLNRFTVLDTDSFLPEFRPDGPAVPLVEYKINYPIEGTDFIFSGVVDAVVIDNLNGHIVVLDWKTKSNFIREDDELMNMQVGLYQYALQQMGLQISRGLVYQIKSSIRRPNLNKPDKNGVAAMSRRIITTTWGVYEAGLIAANLDPMEYDDIKHVLSENEGDLFLPLNIYRSPSLLTNLWNQLKIQLSHIVADTGDRAMALGFSCYSCPFKQLCHYKMEGWSIEELLKDGFIRLPERESNALINNSDT